MDDFKNLTNSTFFFLNRSPLHQTLFFTTSIMSIIIDLFVITIIIRVRSKLLRTEFLILLHLNALSCLYSIVSSLIATEFFQKKTNTSFRLDCYVGFVIQIIVVFSTSTHIFYYSLFHLTLVTKPFRLAKLNKFIDRSKNFYIFSILTLACFVGFTFPVILLIYNNLNKLESYNICKIPIIDRNLAYILFSVMVSLILSFVNYSISSAIVINGLISSKRKNIHSNEKRAMRKTLKLIFKFMIFTILNFFKICPFAVISYSTFFCEKCLAYLSTYITVAYLTFLIQPILLIFIHRIINIEFKQLLKKFKDLFCKT